MPRLEGACLFDGGTCRGRAVVRGRCALHAPATAGRGYDPAWALHSRARIRAEGRCHFCGATVDLTTDHPTDLVLCRSCHGALEAERRRLGRSRGGRSVVRGGEGALRGPTGPSTETLAPISAPFPVSAKGSRGRKRPKGARRPRR
jgi:hypothetical protein